MCSRDDDPTQHDVPRALYAGDKAPEVRWAPNRPSVCYAGTCNHRQHDGVPNPRHPDNKKEN